MVKHYNCKLYRGLLSIPEPPSVEFNKTNIRKLAQKLDLLVVYPNKVRFRKYQVGSTPPYLSIFILYTFPQIYEWANDKTILQGTFAHLHTCAFAPLHLCTDASLHLCTLYLCIFATCFM